jgi:hypothetical protein
MKLLVIALLAATFTVSGCAGYITIPEDYSFPVAGAGEVYDDVVSTPGGAAYRANVRQVGEENPWPSVETTCVTLRSWFGKIWLRYRDHIETEAGETRNNIFWAGQVGGFFDEGRIELCAIDIPPGIELSQYMSGGTIGTLATVLVIEIAPEVTPGQYSLEIVLRIKGRNYGTVPCVIEVVE